MAYQSFPWEPGDSESSTKLAALNLPDLHDRAVLDVGCNTGFFCGYAAWQGAKKVVGIDKNPEFIKTAREIFPQCEFLQKSWDELPEEKFDVILFLSALHYAPDQEKMIQKIVDRLNPHGVLILELGISRETGNRFVEVRRSIDSRFFPTREKIAEMLEPYAAKIIGNSIPQEDDPIPRFIYHIQRKRPRAILLLDDPHSGKSSNAESLFRESINRVSGDVLYYDIMLGRIEAPVPVKKIIEEASAGSTIDCAAATIIACKAGLLGEICRLVETRAGSGDFVLDMYVPRLYRKEMRGIWDGRGYFVIDVRLEDARIRPFRKQAGSKNATRAYMEHLAHNFLINEEDYLKANPDVARAVAAGRMPGAQFHYWHFGRREGRKLKPE